MLACLVPNCPFYTMVPTLFAVPNCPLLHYGAKLSTVPNCPRCQIVHFYTMVPNCPPTWAVPNCPWCQIVLVPNCPRTGSRVWRSNCMITGTCWSPDSTYMCLRFLSVESTDMFLNSRLFCYFFCKNDISRHLQICSSSLTCQSSTSVLMPVYYKCTCNSALLVY